jgi:GT2 family glycosyltransferase
MTAVPAQIVIVVVQYVVEYRSSLDGTPAIESLLSLNRCFAHDPALRENFTTLVWDNSPAPHPMPSGLSFPVEYQHTGENLGVSGAYNRAASFAAEHGAEWLLLLDQDTSLPPDFLTSMLDYARRLAPEPRIGAVAPTVRMGPAHVSPKITVRGGRSIDPPPGFSGEERRELVLVNTGLLLRLESLSQIGGFDPDFWLDFSDRYLCHMLARRGWSVWLAADLQLEHHVSLIAGGISLRRYANLLAAEDAFFTLYRSLPRNLIYCQRLLRNAWRERKTDPERARLLARHLLRRFTISRHRRLQAWRADTVAARRRDGVVNP